MSDRRHDQVSTALAQAMPTRPLGRTGHQVGLFSLGGQGIIEQARVEDVAIAVVRRPGTISMQEALHYVWTHLVSTAIVGCDHPGQVEANAVAARRFTRLSAEHMQDLEARTAPIARQSLYFRHWADV